MKFIRPKTPPRKTSGYLIIESDDSNIGDYTHWYPLIEKMLYKNTQWAGRRAISCGFNVNTGTLNTDGKMSDSNIKELHKNNYEIMNHCRHHISLGRFKLARGASRGDIKLLLDSTSNSGLQHLRNAGYIYTYKLFDGTNAEIVKLTDYDTSERSVSLKDPLSNSFDSGASFQLSDESMEELVM